MDGMYDRLFPDLAPLALDQEHDLAIGAAGGLMDTTSRGDVPEDNPRIPAGWAFFGQVLAHDITHDHAPLQALEEVRGLRNFRTPRLDLEAVYGAGPTGQPYLYQRDDGDKLLVGRNDRGELLDLPRNPEGLAVIGDARNDTYLFISQIHVALLRLHNRIVDDLRASGTRPGNVFSEAQRLTRWHHQWIVVHEYLALTVGDETLADVLSQGVRMEELIGQPFVPIEFAAGVFRFGHAQIRDTYDVNEHVGGVPIFPSLVGQQPVPATRLPDWWRIFAIPGAPPPQPSKRLTTAYAKALMALPLQLTGDLDVPEHASLAFRDLQRATAVALPSGEDVAAALDVEPLRRDEIGLPDDVCPSGTPLIYYVLREADVRADGMHLGPVGGRIVAGVLTELLRADPTSFLSAQPDWRPTLPAAQPGTFKMADMLAAAGLLPEQAPVSEGLLASASVA